MSEWEPCMSSQRHQHHTIYTHINIFCWLFCSSLCVFFHARSCSCSPSCFLALSCTRAMSWKILHRVAVLSFILHALSIFLSLAASYPILSIYSSMCFRCLPSAIMSSLRRQHKYDKRAVIEYLMTWILIYESKRDRITKERARVSFNTSPNKYKFYVACFLHPICLSLLKII